MAYIASSLVGSSYIVIERGNASEMLQDGDTILTRKETGLLGDVKAQLDPTISSVRGILDSLKKTLAGINSVLDSETRMHFRQTIANLDSTSHAMQFYFDTEQGPLHQIFSNITAITERLKTSSIAIEQTTKNAELFSGRLASINLTQTADSLYAVINQLKQLTLSLNNGEGSLGALIKERQLHDQLQRTILSAEILIDDLRTHPKRYTSFSIFGKKDKSPSLQAPLIKDSTPRKNP